MMILIISKKAVDFICQVMTSASIGIYETHPSIPTYSTLNKIVSILQMIFSNVFSWYISYTFQNIALKGSVVNELALVHAGAWGETGEKPYLEPVMTGLLTHVRVTNS